LFLGVGIWLDFGWNFAGIVVEFAFLPFPRPIAEKRRFLRATFN
jgi:hypothetical protein